MASKFTRMNQNAFEQLLSSDINRLQTLASREVLNTFKALSNGANVTPTTVNFANNPEEVEVGVPTSSVDEEVVVTSKGAAMDFTLPGNTGYFYYTPGVTADESAYQVIRWAAQVITVGTAHATLARIDLVIATPGNANADVAARNILVDPTARTIAAQNVYKTVNPTATITLVAGTASATPVPPAVPAGSVALLEVCVPAAITNVANAGYTPRIRRRSVSVSAAIHGVVTGCAPNWPVVASEAVASTPAVNKGTVVIDGELIPFYTGLPTPQNDLANSPQAAAAPANNDRPFFIYLVGGRNHPAGPVTGPTGFGIATPVFQMHSLTVPDVEGRPSATMTSSRGTVPRNAAVFVGIGWTVKNTTLSKACTIDGDWVRAATGLWPARAFDSLPQVGFNDATGFTSGYTGGNITFASKPGITIWDHQLASVLVRLTKVSAGQTLTALSHPTSTNTWNVQVAHPGSNGAYYHEAIMRIPSSGVSAVSYISSALDVSTWVDYIPTAYKMGVIRLGQ